MSVTPPDLALAAQIKSSIREVPDFPKPGVLFYDLTPILASPAVFRKLISAFVERYRDVPIDAIVGIEARGFLFAPSIALELGKPFVPLRKPGKLPAGVEQASYSLEYGSDALEIHRDALLPGNRVVVFDDVIATGGTARAAFQLVEKLAATIHECAVIIELEFLKPRAAIAPRQLFSLIQY